MVRKLKHHEQRLLKKVDFVSWELDGGVKEANVMRKFALKKRSEYVEYNKLSREIRELARSIRDDLSPKDRFRTLATSQLLEKLESLGLVASKRGLEMADDVSASSFCRRRLPVLMAKSAMAQSVALASTMVEHGHVRVGPDLVTDPAFLVTPNLQDFITWTEASAYRKHIQNYQEERDDFADA